MKFHRGFPEKALALDSEILDAEASFGCGQGDDVPGYFALGVMVGLIVSPDEGSLLLHEHI